MTQTGYLEREGVYAPEVPIYIERLLSEFRKTFVHAFGTIEPLTFVEWTMRLLMVA
jgi:hypothetical protein